MGHCLLEKVPILQGRARQRAPQLLSTVEGRAHSKTQLASTGALAVPSPPPAPQTFPPGFTVPVGKPCRGPVSFALVPLALGTPAGHSAAGLLPLTSLLAPPLPVRKTALKIPAAVLRVFEEGIENCL